MRGHHSPERCRRVPIWPNEQYVRDSVATSLAQAIRNYDQGALLQHLMKVKSGADDWLHSARVLSRQRQFPEVVIPVLERALAQADPQQMENAILAVRN